MVRALPEEGAVVIVHSSAMRDYLARMIRDVRGDQMRKACKIVVIQDHSDLDYLKGLSREVFVDHAVFYSLNFILARELNDRVDQIEARFARPAS